jgi:hypothetical protein
MYHKLLVDDLEKFGGKIGDLPDPAIGSAEEARLGDLISQTVG